MEFFALSISILVWTVAMRHRDIPFLVLAGLSILIPGYFILASSTNSSSEPDIANGIAFLISGVIVLAGLGIANFLSLVDRIMVDGSGWARTALNVGAWGILLAADVLAIGLLLIGDIF